MPPQSPKLLDQVRIVLRRKHYSLRTEASYLGWIKRYVVFHGRRHPAELGEAEITAFLSHLAVAEPVATSTQNQALPALLFLYREVLGREVALTIDAVRAKRPARLPTVLSKDEVAALLAAMREPHRLMASCSTAAA